MKHLLKLADLSSEEITEILNVADQLKYEQKNHIKQTYMYGKTLGMIFSKSSTRTRVSFEVSMFQMGGNALFLSDKDLQIGRGESVEDTARVLSKYLDAIMIRTYAQNDVELLAKMASIPVINGLTDYCHPCQVLADLLTIREYKKKLEGLKLCYIGDGNNMANSLIVGCVKTGMKIAIGCPKGYTPDNDIVEFGKKSGLLEITDDVFYAAKDADAVYTDVWASMGQEAEKEERKKVFKTFSVDEKLMSFAKSDAVVLHCLPAHKGEEISEETFEKHADEIFSQAENRLHAQKAALVLCMDTYTK